jgi:hypothetical protein
MRPSGKTQINVAIDPEAAELLRAWATHCRGHGDLLSRLIFEERTRREERRRIAVQLAAVVGDGDAA